MSDSNEQYHIRFDRYSDETPYLIAERLSAGEIHSEIAKVDATIQEKRAAIEALKQEVSADEADKSILGEALKYARDRGLE